MTRDFWHHIQYLLVGMLAAVFAVLYTMAPNGRHEQLGAMMALCVGFMVGKWTGSNGAGGGSGIPDTETRRRVVRHQEEPSSIIKRYVGFLGKYVAWLRHSCAEERRGVAVPCHALPRRKGNSSRPYAA